MKRASNFVRAFAVVSAFVLVFTGLTSAQTRNEREVRDALRSLNSNLDNFESNIRFQMQSASSDAGRLSQVTDDIRSMRDRIYDYQDNLDARRENRDDVKAIVDAARSLDQFMISNPQNRRVSDDWQAVRKQLDRLASNYGVVNNWQSAEEAPQNVKDYPPYPTQNSNPGTFSVGLSGTYDIDRQRSESVDDIVSSSGVGSNQQQDLKDKLDAPEQIALDIRGSQVTLATTKASPVTFTADGRDKTETDANGRTVRLRATLTGDKLIVSSLGGDTDYTITFTSVSSGRGMKVSRRVTTDYLNQTVFAESVYNKTDSVARLGIPTNNGSGNNNSTYDPNGGYSDNDQGGNVSNGGTGNNYPTNTGNTGRPSPVYVKPGNYTVPDGTTMTGIIENEVYTNVSQNNDRFRLTVQSPNEYRGAIIEGYLSNIQRSGKVSGTSQVTFNFERITLRNGQTFDFAGSLKSIVDTTGKSIKVDNESTAKSDSQTTNTAKRGGIGAGIGAVIGAIAGGGKGAILGAIIGGGAGAGSVAVQDRKDVRVIKGSTLTLQAAAPNQNYPR